MIALSIKLPCLFWIHVTKGYSVEGLGVSKIFEEGKYDHVVAQDMASIWDQSIYIHLQHRKPMVCAFTT